MPTFDFKSPDGKTYSIQGPEGATQEQAFQILQQQLGGPPAAPPDKYQQAAIDEQSALKAAGGAAPQSLNKRVSWKAADGEGDAAAAAAALTAAESRGEGGS